MATLKQIEANRLNAQHSTGPTSPEGKAATRFNALKTGIDAKSQVIPGEDPAALTLLTAEYYDRYQPATPEVRALVDALITAEWLQRRFRTLEAQLWQFNIQGLYNPVKGLEMAQVCDPDCDVFSRLQRRIDAERTHHRALLALQKIESLASQPIEPTGPPPPAPDQEPPSNQPPAPENGFVPPIPRLVVSSGPPVENPSAPPTPACQPADKVEVFT